MMVEVGQMFSMDEWCNRCAELEWERGEKVCGLEGGLVSVTSRKSGLGFTEGTWVGKDREEMMERTIEIQTLRNTLVNRSSMRREEVILKFWEKIVEESLFEEQREEDIQFRGPGRNREYSCSWIHRSSNHRNSVTFQEP